MTALSFTVTDAGRAEIINANNTGTGPVTITHIALGSGQYPPAKAQTSLQQEFKRLSVFGGEVVADDVIHVTITDDGPDQYILGEFGLISDKGTLIAVYAQTTPILEKNAEGIVLLSADMTLTSIDANSITFGPAEFVYPPASLTRAGVVVLSNAINSTSQTQAATPQAVKSVNDALESHKAAGSAHTKAQVGLGLLQNWTYSHSYTGGSASKYATEKAVTDSHVYLKGYTDTAIANLVASSPAALDTLNELAAALGDDPNFATTMTNELAKKLNASSYTAADVLAKVKSVDGTGSGLDADLLDGQHGSYYRAWANLTGVPATASRWPDFAEVTGKPATYPPSSHTHDDRYYTKAQGDGRYAGIARDIKNATALGTSALNTITEPGFYYQSANANASTARNYPVLLAGTLIVTEAAGVVQTYIPYGTPGIIYTRGYYGSSWSGWAATYSTANKPSNADVGLSNLQNWSYSHSYTDATGGATKYASGKAVADAYNALNSSKLNASSYTAADVLAKVKSVDGASSGLDADLLDGQHGAYYRAWANLTGVPATFPPSSHAHTWTSITGKPTTFTPSSHSHPWSEVTGKPDQATRWPNWDEVTNKPLIGETFADGSGWGVIGIITTPQGEKALIKQWGVSTANIVSRNVAWPIAFPHKVLGCRVNVHETTDNYAFAQAVNSTITGCTIVVYGNLPGQAPTAFNVNASCYWEAIGY